MKEERLKHMQNSFKYIAMFLSASICIENKCTSIGVPTHTESKFSNIQIIKLTSLYIYLIY